MRVFFILLSFISLSLSASLYVPEKLGSLALLNSPSGFAVLKDNKIHHLGPEAVDNTLRNMDFKQRSLYMLRGGGLTLNQTNDGLYILRAAPKIKGGGPISGWIAHSVTKALGWGCVSIAAAGVITAGTAAIVATGGTAAGAIAAGTAGFAIGGTATGTAAAAGGAAALTAAGVTTATASTVVAGAATTGGVAGLVGGIEGASLAAGAFFTWLPIP